MTNKFKLDLTRRPRRMRRTASLRALASETEVLPQHLIQPIFVIEGEGAPEAIDSMPGIARLSIKATVAECRELHALGISGVALFPKLDESLKSDDGREALNPNTLVLRAIRAPTVSATHSTRARTRHRKLRTDAKPAAGTSPR